MNSSPASRQGSGGNGGNRWEQRWEQQNPDIYADKSPILRLFPLFPPKTTSQNKTGPQRQLVTNLQAVVGRGFRNRHTLCEKVGTVGTAGELTIGMPISPRKGGNSGGNSTAKKWEQGLIWG
jgi:hypothetical protein